MGFEQLILQLVIGAAMGFVTSALAVLADAGNSWNNRQFAYTAIISAFSALAIAQTFIAQFGSINETNVIALILMIAGTSFLANKSIKIAARSGIGKSEEEY